MQIGSDLNVRHSLDKKWRQSTAERIAAHAATSHLTPKSVRATAELHLRGKRQDKKNKTHTTTDSEKDPKRKGNFYCTDIRFYLSGEAAETPWNCTARAGLSRYATGYLVYIYIYIYTLVVLLIHSMGSNLSSGIPSVSCRP
jgi:hypothetical protein